MNARAILWIVALMAASLAAACASEDPPTRTTAGITPLYVAIGASDSVGTGSRNPSSDGWVPVLHSKMPAATRLMNLGIGGIHLPQAVQQELPVAVDAQPSVVTVWLGVNDLAAGVPLVTYRASLDLLLATLANETPARVYVANLPDLTLLPAFRDRDQTELRAEVDRWNAEIAASVQANGATLVDLFAGWTELRDRRDLISRDGLHPSTLGHRRLAELFWNAMQARQAAVGRRQAGATSFASARANGCDQPPPQSPTAACRPPRHG